LLAQPQTIQGGLATYRLYGTGVRVGVIWKEVGVERVEKLILLYVCQLNPGIAMLSLNGLIPATLYSKPNY
jgi:hypothetical protein